MPSFEHESRFWEKGLIIAGCDEAGRGPLAGPVFAAAVSFKPDSIIPKGLDDSKKLSPQKREEIFLKLLEMDIDFAIVSKSNDFIDENNILQSSIIAMNEAAQNLKKIPSHLLIDGNKFNSKINFTTIVKGDSISYSIAAASILAKESRDLFMKKIDLEFPEYGFAQHKGYPTKKHFEAIARYGVTKFHRKTFLKKFFHKQMEIFH